MDSVAVAIMSFLTSAAFATPMDPKADVGKYILMSSDQGNHEQTIQCNTSQLVQRNDVVKNNQNGTSFPKIRIPRSHDPELQRRLASASDEARMPLPKQ